MKVGIMTFWESKNNYGQALQLFALQTHLRHAGHDPFLIKFNRFTQKNEKTFFDKLRDFDLQGFIKNKFNTKQRLLSYEDDKKRQFEAFKQSFITFGDTYYASFEELENNPPVADAYISGSDQVWNNRLHRAPAAPFLLGFGDKKVKRIAYAASFGQRKLDGVTKKLFEGRLPHFDAIGVREKSGVTLCTGMGVTNAQWVLDPTMLISKAQWTKLLNLEAIEEKRAKSSGSQIFIYTLGNSEIKDKDKFISFAKSLKGYDIVHASANTDLSGAVYPTIPEWVNYIRTSKLVITTSFHGMVFCIINNVNFIVLPNTGRTEGMNERIYGLLEELDLKDHILFSFKKGEFQSILEKKVDWKKINEKIDRWKAFSEDFLHVSLQ